MNFPYSTCSGDFLSFYVDILIFPRIFSNDLIKFVTKILLQPTFFVVVVNVVFTLRYDFIYLFIIIKFQG